eukprot:CAMPEP_0172791508 /NCGR_PEP_ID=MMETSP1074-20121228/208505_1 /TAXON_ID=2916 /ORGANISM="Ceratium fusus, Strain PA161109" /LENGTH=120 /DNA_ID=CAMNT_0013628565 /DNA_START=600 /DNA_END=963 /DNA_ORIENTATION=+
MSAEYAVFAALRQTTARFFLTQTPNPAAMAAAAKAAAAAAAAPAAVRVQDQYQHFHKPAACIWMIPAALPVLSTDGDPLLLPTRWSEPGIPQLPSSTAVMPATCINLLIPCAIMQVTCFI